MAERFADLSYARRLKVGAIVVKDNRVISIGYNGTPAGWDNNCEDVLPDGGKHWRYLFRKVDKDNVLVNPEISFYCDLTFDKENRVNDWVFSKMFLQIAPAEFLEASFRSLGSGEINEDKKQLKTKAALTEKIAADLPKKAAVVKHLGEPLEIIEEEKWQIYRYHLGL